MVEETLVLASFQSDTTLAISEFSGVDLTSLYFTQNPSRRPAQGGCEEDELGIGATDCLRLIQLFEMHK